MKIIDISLGISAQLVTWPGDPAVQLERVAKIEEGANANVSQMQLGVHTGTHVDAPVHFIPGGRGVESLRLETLVGRAYVCHLPRLAQITAADLRAAHIPPRARRLLIRTRNSRYWTKGDQTFHTDFVGLGVEAAEWVVARGIQLVGLDYLSVAAWKQSRPVHRILLQAGVIAVEGLNLARVKAGWYELICLPLKLVGSDGAPARALLIE